MRKGTITLVLGAILAVVAIIACNTPNSKNADSKTGGQTSDSLASTNDDTTESCSKPSKYPNQDKPMALMMRQMADNAQKMKDLVLKGEAITAAQFPFIRFHLVEPTDPDVLQPQFYENARLLQVAHKNMISAPVAKQKEMYTAYINQCISCHQIYCSGPLKRIRKLTLDFKP